MKKLRFITILTFFLLLTGVLCASASTAEDLLQTEAGYINDFGEAAIASYYNEISNSQDVDIYTGALNLSVVDLKLPGKNGLDLVIGREYNSQTRDFLPYSTGKNSVRRHPYLCYVYESSDGTNEYIAFNSEEEMLHYAPDYFYANTNFDSVDYTSDSGQRYVLFNHLEITSPGKGEKYTRVQSLRYQTLYDEDTTKLDYALTSSTRDKHRIGHSWSYNVPMIANLDYSSHDRKQYYDSILRDYKGNVYELDYRYNRKNKKIDSFTVTDSYETNDWIPVELSKENLTDETGMVYNFVLQNQEGVKMYFKSSGSSMLTFQITAVEDKYGNRITYTHNLETKEVDIVDTYGRHIHMSPSGITYPDPETGEQKQITYELESVNDPDADPYNLLKTDNDQRFTVTDADGNQTVYHSKIKMPAYSRLPITGYVPQEEYYLNEDSSIWEGKEINALTQIDYPTGKQSHFEYERKYSFLTGDLMQVLHKVVHSSDSVDGDSFNEYSYEYINNLKTKYGPESKDGYVIRDQDGVKVKKHYSNSIYDDTRLSSEKVYTADDTLLSETLYGYHTNRKYIDSIKQNHYTGTNKVENVTKYTYNENNLVTKEVTDDHTIDYTYSDQNVMLTKTWKKDDDTTTLIENIPTEDGKGVAKSVTKVNGVIQSQTAYEYAADGMVVKQTLWEGDTNGDGLWDENDQTVEVNSTYTYHPDTTYTIKNYVTNVADIDGTLTPEIAYTTSYDYNGNVSSVTDPRGYTTQYEYDAASRPLKELFSDGTYQLMEYNVVQNYIVYQDANGIQTKSQFNPLGWLESTAVKDGASWLTTEEYTYDNVGRLTAKRQYLTPTTWETTEYTYNLDDTLASERVKNQSGTVITGTDYTYGIATVQAPYPYKNVTNRIVNTTVLGSGYTIRQTYHPRGFLLKEEQIGDTTRTKTYEYDNVGNCISAKDANAVKNSWDATLTTTYDYAGNVLTQTDALGNTATNVYNGMGLLVQSTDAAGNTTNYTYDDLGRLIQTDSPFDGANRTKSQIYYDAGGNKIKEKQQINDFQEGISYSTVEYTYDSKNRLTLTTAYDGATPRQTAYTYDAGGRQLTLSTGADSTPQTTSYEYNSLGQMTKVTDPLGLSQTYQYDYKGNALSTVDKNGQTVTTTYNALSLPLYVSAGNLSRSFTYDQAGRRLSMTDESGTSNYTYDSFGQLITETDGNGGVKTYTYDDNGNRLTFTLTVNGTQLISAAYEYDKLNRLTKVTLDGDTTTYTYDENGNILNTTTGDLVSQYTYNDAGLVTSLSNQQGGNPISTYSYQYYADGNQKSKTENGVLTSYEYDTLRRLTKESSGSDVTTYSFDPYGNRASMQTTGSQASTVTYTYNAKNQLLTESKNVGETTEVTNYAYDNNGNLTSKTIDGTGTLYEYNAFNQLSHSERGIYITNYTYNGDGLRMKKWTNGGETLHYWDGDNIVAEKLVNRTSVYARGLSLISCKSNTRKGYYVQNAHGDITKIVPSGDGITVDYEYDAYGNSEQEKDRYGNPFRYCGEYWDEETENIYLRARYYDSATGRFISEDPIRDGVNWYVYANNNPVMFVDPTGLIVTAWDKAHCTDQELKLLEEYTNNWKTDPNAHAKAEAIRNQYRINGESGGVDGNTYSPNGTKYHTYLYVDNATLQAAPQKDVIDFSITYGTGIQANVKLFGFGAEVGAKMYYDLTNIATDSPTQSLEFSIMAEATDNVQIGGSITGTVNAATREHLQNQGFVGIKIGNTTFGWDNLPKNQDFVIDAISLGGYLGAGGEVNVKINVSEFIRRIFN